MIEGAGWGMSIHSLWYLMNVVLNKVKTSKKSILQKLSFSTYITMNLANLNQIFRFHAIL